MKKNLAMKFVLVMLGLVCFAQTRAQESRVYLSVVSTKLFVVGAANPQTGVFFQRPAEDTVWGHTGPVNIRAFGVAVHPGSAEKLIYIASGNGVHRTTDGGQTWKITTNWQITEVLSVGPDPHDLRTVYAATPYGIFKTTDGCETWKEMNNGFVSTFSSCVIVDHARPGRVYCATEEGAYMSENGGASWRRFGPSVDGARVIAQHPTNPDILIVGTEEYGLYMTTNGGRWWARREAGVDHMTFYAAAFAPNKPDVMYAGGYVTGVYKSTDGGGSWKRVNNGLNDLNIHAIAVDPLNSERVYVGTHSGGVFRTDDGGGSWRNVGMPESLVWSVQFAKN